MGNEVDKYNKYKRDLRLMFFGCGLWPGFRETPDCIDTFLSYFAGIVSGLTILGIIWFCIENSNNINLLVKGVGITFSFSSSFIKIWCMIIYRRDMVILNRGISKRFEDDLKNEESIPHLMTHFSSIRRFFYAFDYILGLYNNMMIFLPLLALRHGKYVRAYPQSVPFHYEPGGIIHWTIYAIEVICCLYLWRVTCGTDSLFGLYTLHITGELRLLSYRFTELSFSKNYKKDLKDCIDRHILIYKSHRLIQKCFGLLSIWLTISCAIIICAIIFQSTEMKNLGTYRAIYLTSYVTLKLMQAYSYAWFGNTISVDSELCLNSIYNSKWPESGNVQFMNDVLIVQSQNHLTFKALGCMLVRLDMFSKIVQTSVSYFFLLRTLEEST